jgi:hypothetical protein
LPLALACSLLARTYYFFQVLSTKSSGFTFCTRPLMVTVGLMDFQSSRPLSPFSGRFCPPVTCSLRDVCMELCIHRALAVASATNSQTVLLTWLLQRFSMTSFCSQAIQMTIRNRFSRRSLVQLILAAYPGHSYNRCLHNRFSNRFSGTSLVPTTSFLRRNVLAGHHQSG